MRARIATAIVASFLAFVAGGAFAAGTSTTTELTSKVVKAQLINVEELIRKEKYSDAISVLNGIVETNPKEADAYNLLGYSYRKSKDYNRAERNYKRALGLNPDHKGALEYVGELYLETDRRGKAEETLAKLEKLCPSGCEELEDLRKAMATDGQTSKANW
ncbi:MAG: tetratricopeptide repeat protein [Alphaproteobacteria bacterium]|nr:tetratricopeptide repeat protein [Alphaproteobacteria bacterium]